MSTQLQKEEAASTSRRDQDTFASSAAGSWSALNAAAPLRVYPAGVEMFRQDTPAREVYFIDRGLVKLIHLEQDGREMIVALRSPGWVVAAAAAILNEAHLFTGVTLTDCSLRRIPSEVFCRLLHTNGETSWYLHRMHSREVYDQTNRVAQLGCLPARYRLEQLLWQLICASGSHQARHEIKVELPLKQQEIAALIAVTPEYLSRMLKELEHDGTLHRRKGWIVIPDPQRLRHRDGC